MDALTPETPVFVDRYDGHMALANSLALQLAGVTRDDAGARRGRDRPRRAAGEPTGVLKDAAMSLVSRVDPAALAASAACGAPRGRCAHAASLGVTSVQDMDPGPEDVAVYAELLERGELTARSPPRRRERAWRSSPRLGLRRAFGSPWLRLGALKGFADGSLGSTTAFFFEPYTDAPADERPAVGRDAADRGDARRGW